MLNRSYFQKEKINELNPTDIHALIAIGTITDLFDNRINAESVTDLAEQISSAIHIAKNRALQTIENLKKHLFIQVKNGHLFNLSAKRAEKDNRSYHYIPHFSFFNEKKRDLFNLPGKSLKFLFILLSNHKAGHIHRYTVEKMYKTQTFKGKSTVPFLESFEDTYKMLQPLIEKGFIHLRFTQNNGKQTWVHQDNFQEAFPEFLSYCGKEYEKRKSRFRFRNHTYHNIYIRINPRLIFDFSDVNEEELNKKLFSNNYVWYLNKLSNRGENRKRKVISIHERLSGLYDVQVAALKHQQDFFLLTEALPEVRKEIYMLKDRLVKDFSTFGIEIFRNALDKYFAAQGESFIDELARGMFVSNLESYYVNTTIRTEFLKRADKILQCSTSEVHSIDNSTQLFINNAYGHFKNLKLNDHLVLLDVELSNEQKQALPNEIFKDFMTTVNRIYKEEEDTLNRDRAAVIEAARSLTLKKKIRPVSANNHNNSTQPYSRPYKKYIREEKLPDWFYETDQHAQQEEFDEAKERKRKEIEERIRTRRSKLAQSSNQENEKS